MATKDCTHLEGDARCGNSGLPQRFRVERRSTWTATCAGSGKSDWCTRSPRVAAWCPRWYRHAYVSLIEHSLKSTVISNSHTWASLGRSVLANAAILLRSRSRRLEKRDGCALASGALLCLMIAPSALAQPSWVDRVAGNPNVWIDGIPAKDALLGEPKGIAFDSSGNLYIADAGTHRILRVDTTGVITTVAGTGHAGFSGDGGPATNASLELHSSLPSGVAFDPQGNLYIADIWNNRVRKVDRAGIITTVAGTDEWGCCGSSGDGGPAVAAQLNGPAAVAFDSQGNLFIADHWNNRVRKVDRAGIITTVAGTDEQGFSGDGGPATAAQLGGPLAVAFDSQGNLFIADHWNNRVRKIDRAGIITTVAGTGEQGFSGDGGPATAAQLGYPDSVAFDSQGNLYIAGSWSIRRVTTAGTITTLVRQGGHRGGDCGQLSYASIQPMALAVDSSGRIYFSDGLSGTVRRISGQRPIECGAPLTPLEAWSVASGEVSFAGFSSRGCLIPSDPEIWGQAYVVHSSEWQRRPPGENVWVTVGGTLRTGRICAHSPNGQGEYRAVAEMSVDGGERTRYRSVNTIAGSSGTANDQPRFGAASIGDQTYVSGTAILPLALPAASGGDSPLLYRLEPTVPGLSFDSQARRLSGTPTSAGTYSMRFSVRDSDGDTATLPFTITVRSGGVSAGARRYRVNDLITTLPTGFWAPDVTSGGSFQYSAGTATVRLNNGGYIDEGDYRYTCESSGGCEVVNRTVTAGVVVETSEADGEPLPAADDHGDTRSAASGLTLGTPVAGRVDPGDDTDYFQLRLSQSTAVAIYTTGSLDTTGSLQDSSGNQVASDDDGGTGTNFRIEATLSAGTHYVAVGSIFRGIGDYTLHAERRESGTGPTSPAGTQYTPLDDWTVSSGRVQFLFFGAGTCVELSGTTINGVTYTIHSSRWQRRENSASGWVDIPGTEATGAVCSYTPSEAGQYRGAAEITIGGTRGNYATKNVLTVEASGGRGSVSGSVAIPDTNLRAAIAAALGKVSNAPITQVELATLTYLDASDEGISDLIGLEAATNLDTLHLSDNNITDISPLAGLTNLTRLTLGSNNITDISPLAGLTNLTGQLSLSDNNIEDISPLAGLTNLEELSIGLNDITDISLLSNLTNLTELRVGDADIRDISPVAGLTKLTDLSILAANIQDEDLALLSGLTNLTSLALSPQQHRGHLAAHGLDRADAAVALGQPDRGHLAAHGLDRADVSQPWEEQHHRRFATCGPDEPDGDVSA